MDGVGY